MSVFTNFSLLSKDSKTTTGHIVQDSRGVTPDGKKYLDISIVATHAGILNLNTRFYLPSRMKDGVNSFTNKNKPVKILKNHNTEKAFGIVLDAEYIDTTPNQLLFNRDVQILNDSSHSIEDQLKAARNFIKDGIPFLDGWEGLGYIKIRARILDVETIEEIESGLFDSVSTSFRSKGMYCSVCGDKWGGMMEAMFGGGCGHTPGGLYPIPDDNEEENNDSSKEKVFCCLVPDFHDYQECSLVVFGADPITIININNDQKNSLYLQSDKIIELLSCKPSESVGFVFNDIKEDKMGAKLEDKKTDNPQDTENAKKFEFSYRKMIESLSNSDSIDIDKLESELASLPDSVFCGPDKSFPILDSLHCKAALQYIDSIENLDGKEEIVKKINDKFVVFNNEDLYSNFEDEFDLMKKEGLISEDAKLSAEERKKLPDSAFCGPDRSFPVPDCAHVTAARRLIGRYEGPGDKDKILACVNRKAKSLGCDKEEDKTCEQCNKLSEQLDSLKSKITTLEDHSRVLRSEWNDAYSDYRTLFDNHVSFVAKAKDHVADLCAIVATLKGEEDSIELAKEKFSSVDDIITLKEKLLSDFDITKITGKINDGMENKPTSKIDSPLDTDNLEDSKTKEDVNLDDSWKEKYATKVALKQINDMLDAGEKSEARKYFESTRKYKIFPDDFKFESLVKNS